MTIDSLIRKNNNIQDTLPTASILNGIDKNGDGS